MSLEKNRGEREKDIFILAYKIFRHARFFFSF